MKIKTLLLLIFISTYSASQTTVQTRDGYESEAANKDYKTFTAKNGSIVRKEMVIMDDLKLSQGLFGYTLNTSIEKIIIGETSRLYYNITAWDTNKDYSAHIKASHLKQVIDALDVLLKQSTEDRQIGTKKFNNYFVTDDDFRIGYYTVPTRKEVLLYWYLSLERYGVNYRFVFWQEESFYKAVKSMKVAYETLKNSQE